MRSLTIAPKRFTLYTAVLAITALVITVLAVTYAAGPAQAQNSAGSHPDPQPCGSGAAAVPDNPDQRITSGQYALFDAYWDADSKTPNNNLCPPATAHTATTVPGKGGKPATATIDSERTPANIDIGKTVIHISDDYKTTITQGDLDTYGFLADAGLEAGDEVYWLKADDRRVPGAGSSDLVLGFSTALFDGKYWHEGDGTPLQYEFEALREPGILPSEYGHFFAFEPASSADPDDKGKYTPDGIIWNSADADTNEIEMKAGEYRHVQWIFTKPDRYVLSVHFKGHVRQENPDPDNITDEQWEQQRLTEDRTVTSEVKEYTLHVGKLVVDQQPRFRLLREVEENSPPGTKVGNPVGVIHDEDASLTYSLSGPGHKHFTVAADANGDAQISTASSQPGLAGLDYEVRDTYDLVLSVSDGKDWRGDPDDSVDDTSVIRVRVLDVEEPSGVTLGVSQNSIKLGGTLYLRASLGDLPAGATFQNFFFEHTPSDSQIWYPTNVDNPTTRAEVIIVGNPDDPGLRRYRVTANVSPSSANQRSSESSVTWNE